MKSDFFKNQQFQILSRSEQRNIIGGYVDPPSLCEVYCEKKKKWESKDCGRGVSCSAVGTTIQCVSDPANEMCS